jgi:hypothetical protein
VRLVFLLADNASLPATLIDIDRGPAEMFRRRVRDAGLIVQTFTSADGLAFEVRHALAELAEHQPPAPPLAKPTAEPRWQVGPVLELARAQVRAADDFPYRLVGARQAGLSSVYVRQDITESRPAADARATTDGQHILD